MQIGVLSLSQAYINSYKGLSKNCWKGIFLGLTESIFIGVFYFLSIYFVNNLHFSVANSGLILSFYGLGTIFGGILSGKLSDKFLPKKIAAFSLTIQGIGYLFLIKITSLQLLIINSFVLGFAAYGFITANHLWVLTQCEKNKKLKALNLLSTASNLGLSISAFCISSIIYFGFHYIFLFSGVSLLLLSTHLFFHKENHQLELTTSGENHQTLENKKEINSLVFNRLIMYAIVFFIGLIIAQNSSTYPIYIETIFPNLGIKGVSYLFILNTLLVVLFEVPIGNFTIRFNKVIVVGCGCFLIGFGMFLLSMSSLFILAALACVIYTVGEILFFSMAQLLCYDSGSKKGRALGMFRTIYASSRAVGPVAGGFIYSYLGGQIVWYLSGLIGIICFTICMSYKKHY